MSVDLPGDEHSLVAPGEAAKPEDSMRLIAQGGQAVSAAVAITGKEKFEFMVLYCLRLLDQGKGAICGFYLQDFDDCDEHTMRVIQKLISRSGYVCSDFIDAATKKYNGFWAWRKKEEPGQAPPSSTKPAPQHPPQPPQPPKMREF
jgi:hypothetical protein